MFFICMVGQANQEASLYDIKTKWQDQNSTDTTLKELGGVPMIISMVYTSCPHSCPMTISKIETIKKQFEKAGYKNIKYVVASFDDQNDTPEKLKAFMTGRKMNESQWTFLSPKKEATARELSVVLGISFKKLGKSDFSHSNVITLLDKNGIPIEKIDSLSADIKPFLKAIKKNN